VTEDEHVSLQMVTIQRYHEELAAREMSLRSLGHVRWTHFNAGDMSDADVEAVAELFDACRSASFMAADFRLRPERRGELIAAFERLISNTVETMNFLGGRAWVTRRIEGAL
jgi:hypothetical protein